MESFWWYFGIILIVLEFMLPGLVSVFIGLGAITVAALMHYQVITGLGVQFAAWLVVSLAYIFSLRLLVIRFYPSDIERKNIDADYDLIGTSTKVVEEIVEGGIGRVTHGESTWQAKSQGGERISVGETVQIVGRDNITWIVDKNPKGGC